MLPQGRVLPGASPRQSRWPHRETNHHWFPWWTRPRRTQCGVGADDGCVTGGYRPRCDPLIGPPAPPSQETRLRIGGLSPLSSLTFFAAAKKVSAAPHRGNANKPISKETPNAVGTTTKHHHQAQPLRAPNYHDKTGPSTMATKTPLPAEPDQDPTDTPPTDISKPIGDAIPTPVEPGLDQPLPEKAKPDRLGETDPPPGVPAPGPSDFA